MCIRWAKPEDFETVKALWKTCFDDSPSFIQYYFQYKYKPENTLVLEADGRIVTALQLNPYILYLNNVGYPTRYIVGVATDPSYRRRGYMRKIMQYAMEWMESRYALSILMPANNRYYTPFGYEYYADQLEITIKDSKEVQIGEPSGELCRGEEKDIPKLVSAYHQYTRKMNGYVLRDEGHYHILFKEIQSEKGEIYFVQEAGECTGYMIVFEEKDEKGKQIIVQELIYQKIDTLWTLLSFLKKKNLPLKIHEAMNRPLRYMLPNAKTIQVFHHQFMMGRILGVRSFFEQNIFPGVTGEISIETIDPILGINNKVFVLKFKNGKCIIEEHEEEPQMIMDIGALTQLAFGYCSIEILSQLGRVKINDGDASKLMQQIFPLKHNFINEYV